MGATLEFKLSQTEWLNKNKKNDDVRQGFCFGAATKWVSEQFNDRPFSFRDNADALLQESSKRQEEYIKSAQDSGGEVKNKNKSNGVIIQEAEIKIFEKISKFYRYDSYYEWNPFLKCQWNSDGKAAMLICLNWFTNDNKHHAHAVAVFRGGDKIIRFMDINYGQVLFERDDYLCAASKWVKDYISHNYGKNERRGDIYIHQTGEEIFRRIIVQSNLSPPQKAAV